VDARNLPPQTGLLEIVQWIVSKLGLDCLHVVYNSGQKQGRTVVFVACDEGYPEVVEHVFDVLGARRYGRRGKPPQCGAGSSARSQRAPAWISTSHCTFLLVHVVALQRVGAAHLDESNLHFTRL